MPSSKKSPSSAPLHAPKKTSERPYWTRPVKRKPEPAERVVKRVDESASGWWMALNDEDMEIYGAIFAEQGKTIDRAFASVRNEIDEEKKIKRTQIKRRFYLIKNGVHVQTVDEDMDIT